MPDGAAMVAAYVLDLQRYPLWAIDAGLAAIVRGTAGTAPQYAPTSLQVQAAVETAMRPVRDEIALLCAVLDAAVLPDAHGPARARVQAGFARLRVDLGLSQTIKSPDRETNEAQA